MEAIPTYISPYIGTIQLVFFFIVPLYTFAIGTRSFIKGHPKTASAHTPRKVSNKQKKKRVPAVLLL